MLVNMKLIYALRYIRVFLFVVQWGMCGQSVVYVPNLNPEAGRFVDMTGRVDRDLIEDLDQKAAQIELLGFQMAGVFVTGTTCPGFEFAKMFGDKNGIGQNGIIIVVFLDRKLRWKSRGRLREAPGPIISIKTGSKFKDILSYAKLVRFLKQTFEPARRKGEWEQGLIDFVAKVHRYLKNPDADEFKYDVGSTGEFLFASVCASIILVYDFIKRRKSHKKTRKSGKK